ncbi:hypothetical protein PENSTE_c002G05961 [Penicillium steckii]|uniref:Uncharacterized protein n=1 Tax=Penicillium steckii TaxID=303698 RepID=A0A1V6TUD2_9EURO|nr:hypothetical protein PENSTE_c002G05961 [Penicillium steckii]
MKSLFPFRSQKSDKKEEASLTRQSNYLAGLENDQASTEEVETQLDWIKKHKHEVRRGHRMIQHEMHLGAKLFHYESIEEQAMTLSPLLHGTQQVQIDECTRQLQRLRDDFITHLQRVAEMEDTKPSGSLVKEYLKKVQQQEKLQPQTLWKFERIYCQLRGGCCSHNCGCCERSWRTIRDHSSRVHYLHCGRSCGCCNRRRVAIKVS